IIGLFGGIIGIIAGSVAAYVLPGFLTLGAHSSTASSPAVATAGSHSSFAGGGFAGRPGGFAGSAASSSTSASSISFTPVISPTVIIVAMLIAIVVSSLASMYPAWKASRISPIEALRTE
ncbi:MAG: FtsX-like permease family protein, partial [Candidatus Micrarchaeaceae archaeon]